MKRGKGKNNSTRTIQYHYSYYKMNKKYVVKGINLIKYQQIINKILLKAFDLFLTKATPLHIPYLGFFSCREITPYYKSKTTGKIKNFNRIGVNYKSTYDYFIKQFPEKSIEDIKQYLINELNNGNDLYQIKKLILLLFGKNLKGILI